MTTVVVLGAGALGSVYGAWFAEAGAEVTLVARPAHAAAVNRGGLRIDDRPPIEVKAVSDPASAGDCDVLLLASKAFDNSELLDRYKGTAQAAFLCSKWGAPSRSSCEAFWERGGGLRIACGRHAGRTG